MITKTDPSPTKYLGQCIHCKGNMWYNEDTEKVVSRGLPGCLCETEEDEEEDEE